MSWNQLSEEEAQSFRKRVEYEDEVLNTRTNIVLTLNGLAAVAVGLSLPSAAKLCLAVIMIVIDGVWITCAMEADRYIGALIQKLQESKAAIPADEAFRWELVHKRVRLGPTKFIGVFMPLLLLLGWLFAVVYAAWSAYPLQTLRRPMEQIMDLVWTVLKDGVFWIMIGALATIAASLGIGLALRQLRFDAWLKAQEIFVDKEFTEACGKVLGHLASPDSTWDSQDEKAGLLVCRRMDELCRLAPFFAMTTSRGQKVILKGWAHPIAKSWALLRPLVSTEPKKDGWKKWEAFEILGEKALSELSQAELRLVSPTADRITKALEASGSNHLLAAGPPNDVRIRVARCLVRS